MKRAFTEYEFLAKKDVNNALDSTILGRSAHT